ncbi:MAG: sensor histidine kinase [Spirochaetaceae bacterium]|nr:MAG: sensor histidine kinase [Spirochaetaceae bacterium]
MNKKLEHVFRRSAALFLLIYLILLIGAYLVPTVNRRREQVHMALQTSAQMHALRLEREMVALQERVYALASRTVIRHALRDYLDGRISRAELQQQTQARYADGVAVYDDLQSAARYDIRGELVAAYGEPPPLMRAAVPSGAAAEFAIERVGAHDLLVTVAVPIVDNDRLLGQDSVRFLLARALLPSMQRLTLTLVDDADNVQRGSAGRSEASTYTLSFALAGTGLLLQASYQPVTVAAAIAELEAAALWFIVLSAVAMLLVWYVTLYRGVRPLFQTLVQQEAQLSEALQQRELVVRETNHRVKNNLNMVMGMIDLQLHSSEPDSDRQAALQSAMQELKQRLRSVSTIHDMLHSGQDLQQVELRSYLQRLVEQTVASLAAADVRLLLRGPQVSVHADTAVIVGLVVSELCTNALKYGLDQGGELVVEIDQADNADSAGASGNLLTIAVENSGRLMPQQIDPYRSQGFGLRMIRLLVEQLGGSLEFQRTPQTAFRFSFPA